MSVIVKHKDLVKAQACERELHMFREEFGAQVRLTYELLLKNANRYSIGFLSQRPFMTSKQENEYYRLNEEARQRYYSHWIWRDYMRERAKIVAQVLGLKPKPKAKAKKKVVAKKAKRKIAKRAAKRIIK